MKKEEVLNQIILENSKIIEDIVFDITKHYTDPLDKIMINCRAIFNSGISITNQEIEDLLTQLPSTLYFVNEGQEKVGIKQDIAEMTRKSKYNEAREKAVGTVADKNNTAEGYVLNEALNEVIYERSYKMIRSKIDMGQEMINSLKRVFDARMIDYQINGGKR